MIEIFVVAYALSKPPYIRLHENDKGGLQSACAEAKANTDGKLFRVVFGDNPTIEAGTCANIDAVPAHVEFRPDAKPNRWNHNPFFTPTLNGEVHVIPASAGGGE